MDPRTTFLAHCTERRTFSGRVLDCPDCGTDSYLIFTTVGSSTEVTGSCPNLHVWVEDRYPAEAVRAAAIASHGKGGGGRTIICDHKTN